MPSLQGQIDFVQKEYDRSKLVYKSLLEEFGEKNIPLLDKEISERLQFYAAINHSLQELETLKSKSNGSKR